MFRLALIVAILVPIFVAAAVHAASPTLVVEPLSGPTRSGRIKSWSLRDGLLIDAPGESRPIESRDLSRVTNPGAVPRAGSGEWTFVLTDGQRIPGRIESGDEIHLTVRHAGLGPLVIPLESIASIIAGDATAARRPPGETDRVVLANGDVAVGIIREINRDKLRIADAASENERSIDPTLLRRADFANPTTQPAPGIAALVRLTDGASIRACELNWHDDAVDLQLLGRQRARLAPESIRAVEIVGGPRVWLSELEPTAFEHNPILGPTHALGRDVNALGQPLRVGGRRYDRGLGLHSAQRLEYALGGRFSQFRADIALDDSAGPLADVTLRVILDGREAARLEHLRAGQAAQQLDVDLSDADRMLIEVDPAANADIQDRIDLLDAALLKH